MAERSCPFKKAGDNCSCPCGLGICQFPRVRVRGGWLSGGACCTVTWLKRRRLSAALRWDVNLIDVTFYRWCSSCCALSSAQRAGRGRGREESGIISWCVMTGSLKAKPLHAVYLQRRSVWRQISGLSTLLTAAPSSKSMETSHRQTWKPKECRQTQCLTHKTSKAPDKSYKDPRVQKKAQSHWSL